MAEDIVPYGEALDDEDVVKQFFRHLQDAEDYFLSIHEKAAKAFAIYGVDGQDAKDKAFKDELKRISVDLPFCKGIVDTIMGADMAQATEPQWQPGDDTKHDVSISDLLTRVVRDVRQKSDGHREESATYFDMLIGGYGFAEAYMDMTRVPVRPVESHIEPWEVFPDPDAVKDNLTDARYWIRVSDWQLQSVQARWPEKKQEIDGGVKSQVVMRTAPTVARPVRSKENKWTRKAVPGSTPKGHGDKVTVYEYQYCLDEPRVVYYDPENGERVDAPYVEYLARKKEIDDQAKAILDTYAQQLAAGFTSDEPPAVPEMLDVHNYGGKTWYRCYLLGNATTRKGMLLERKTLAIEGPTIKALTGFKAKDPETGRIRFFGIMPVIQGIEFWMTKGFETYLEILARGAKGGMSLEKRAIPQGMSEDAFRKQYSIPGNLKILADGALSGPEGSAIQYDPVVQEPSAFWRLVEVCRELLGFLTGVTPALQGTFEGDRSNVFISNLQEQGLQMLLPIREPKTAFVVSMGRLLASLVVHHLPAAEIDKILGDLELEGLTHMKQLNPQTGQEELVPMPEIDEQTGQPLLGPDGQPILVTAGALLKNPDVLKYDVKATVGAATPSQRQDTWRWVSTGFGKTLQEWGVPADIMVPPLVRNAPLPGTITEKMADDLESFYAEQKKMQTAQGITEFFQQMAAEDFQGAAQLLQQLSSVLQQPANAPAEETAN